MTQTDININVGEPNLINPVNTKTTTLPFNVETDLKEYSRIFITREFDPFRLIHCCEAPNVITKYMAKQKKKIKSFYLHVPIIINVAIVVSNSLLVIFAADMLVVILLNFK